MKKRAEKNPALEIAGMAGWLLVFVIFVIVSAVLSIYNVAPFLKYILGGDLTLKIVLVTSIISVLLAVNSLILIFRKSKYAPIWVIVFLLYDIVVNINYYLINVNPLMDQAVYIFLTLIAVTMDLAWVLYFNYSQRVRNTFL